MIIISKLPQLTSNEEIDNATDKAGLGRSLERRGIYRLC